MKIETFIEELTIDFEHGKEPFMRNMKMFTVSNRSFCEWVSMFVAWMEWGIDCPETHIRYEEDEI